ncbi:hypothetical protein [Legionella fallonii]|uniref:RNA binding protein (Contains ribosomal protein S1 domain) n=1 Tax=Legionella fallonii LLAP-10 TaxID=1212491 RepID=A0A098G9T2_9GAMM|nr:hypothetical protein [Legionella fallonii]CEG58760.1 conserved protein of unknown function [Legionella fallonii LLAP-10]
MIVLYVPFAHHAAGDLTSSVEHWKKNHQLNSSHPIRIIFYGDDSDLDTALLANEPLEIFICAHGADEHPNQLANNSDFSKTNWLDIKEVAARFNSDFLIVAHQISAIHCYCCGSDHKNKALASLFRTHLLRSGMPIFSYGGSLFGADHKGILWAVKGNQKIQARDTAYILFSREESLGELSSRKHPKEVDWTALHEQCREKRREQFFAGIKERKRKNRDAHREASFSSQKSNYNF